MSQPNLEWAVASPGGGLTRAGIPSPATRKLFRQTEPLLRHVRSDDGPEFVATAVRAWIAAVRAKTAFIEPGSPWENGDVESFNSKLRDELPCGELFCALRGPQALAEARRRHHDTLGPHSALGWRAPPHAPGPDRLSRAMADVVTREQDGPHDRRPPA